jgi:2-keto-4-pentenoate hydratase/2-oxohepta-3-ene-1,7-dioic acid hydratase in catechol pathway
MRIATLQYQNRRSLGLVLEGTESLILPLEMASNLTSSGGASPFQPPPDMMAFIHSAPDVLDRLEDLAANAKEDWSMRDILLDLGQVKLCAPLNHPGKLICLAGNYREHITESGFQAPQQSDTVTPQLFLKPPTSLVGDNDDVLIGKNNVTVGWEAELAVIIGKPGRNIEERDAFGHVFGYTILNDISERRFNSGIQNRRKREFDPFFDWLAGKWFDSFAPCGPWIVTADAIPDPHNLEIRLWVNGQLRQQGNTADMIFRIPELISHISSIMTLEPGDVISTGTPAGAGIGGESSLRNGDEVVCEIEKIGRLRNTVRRRSTLTEG